jgi:hypothetical protein
VGGGGEGAVVYLEEDAAPLLLLVDHGPVDGVGPSVTGNACDNRCVKTSQLM